MNYYYFLFYVLLYYCYYQFVLLIEYLSKFINIDLMESMEPIEPIEPINNCLICLEKLNKDKHLCITPCCLQKIHLDCIKICIIFNPLCPNCRNPICKNILYKVKFRTEKQFAEDIAIRQHRFKMLIQIKKIYDVVPDVDNNIDDYNYVNNYDDADDIDYSDMPELI